MRAIALLGTAIALLNPHLTPRGRDVALVGRKRPVARHNGPVTVAVPAIYGRPHNRKQRRAIKAARVAAGKETWR